MIRAQGLPAVLRGTEEFREHVETVGLGHNRGLDAEDVAHAIVEFLCALPGAGAVASGITVPYDGSRDENVLEQTKDQRAPA